MSATVDVLAVIDAELRTARGLASSDAYYAHFLPKLEAAHGAVAELFAALREVETICTESPRACRQRMGTRVGNCLTTARAALARCQP